MFLTTNKKACRIHPSRQIVPQGRKEVGSLKIGAMELIVIFIVALLVIGPDKLPSYAKKFGSALREFRKASADMTQDIRESVVEPLEEAQRPLREAMEPLDDLKKDVEGSFKGVEKDLRNIGRATPKDKGPSEAEKADPAIDSAGTESTSAPEAPADASEVSPSEDSAPMPGAAAPVSEPVLRPASEEAAADIQENDQVTTGGTT